MATSYDDVVRVYGENSQESRFKPKSLTIPRWSPRAPEIQDQRQLAAFTKEQAAEICDVTIKTWTRWETGKGDMPRVTWGWFRIVTSGGVTAGGPDWEGWGFHEGLLYSPENWGGFSAGELRSWFYKNAQLAELKRINRELEEELKRAKQNYSARSTAIGKIDLFGLITSQLIKDYKQNDDPLLQELGNSLYDVMKVIATARAPLIR